MPYGEGEEATGMTGGDHSKKKARKMITPRIPLTLQQVVRATDTAAAAAVMMRGGGGSKDTSHGFLTILLVLLLTVMTAPRAAAVKAAKVTKAVPTLEDGMNY
jgi:hypothetical protein